jgi:hypothetical protein
MDRPRAPADTAGARPADDSGNTRICETFEGMGNIVSKSRCYQSGRDTRCDNQSINSTAPLPVPFIAKGDRPQR